MCMLIYLLRGLALGFAIVAPVGPIGVLCIRRTLVAAALVELRLWTHLLRAVFLAWLGLRTLLSCPEAPPSEKPAAAATALSTPAPRGLLAAWATTVALTLTNPATVLSFFALVSLAPGL